MDGRGGGEDGVPREQVWTGQMGTWKTEREQMGSR